MVGALKSIRQRIREANAYVPQKPRKAHRAYIKGTRQTKKKPGDLVINERGKVFVVNTRGGLVPKSI